jgi:uncharacterized protein (UPF0276 family)
MKIGITYNPYKKEVEQAITENSDNLDFIELKHLESNLLHSKLKIIDKIPRKSMHVQYLSKQEKPTTLNLVSDETKEIISDKNSDIYKAFDILDPFIISFHTGFSSKEVGTEGIDNHNYAVSEILPEKEVFRSIIESMKLISKMLRKKGYKGKILIENLDYHPTGAYEYLCEPSFISRIAKNTNCGVLLDLAHTIISAHRFDMDVFDFVEKIGVDLIYEIHVNSPLYKNGEWYDINEPFYFSDEAKGILGYVLDKSPNKELVITIECDKDVIKQIEMIRKERGY